MSSVKIRLLEREHAALDGQINAMTKTGIYDDNKLQALKKQRLAIKDQLNHLRRQAWEETQFFNMDDDR